MQPTRRTKRLLGRIAVPIVAAVLAAFALTYPGSDWFEQLERWTRPAPRSAARALPRVGPVGAPILVTPQRPLGTDSSVSPVPRRLILVRTQPGRNSGEGLAQIGVNPRTPQTYQAGAILANGARLTEIHADYVVLQRDGQSARLDLGSERAAGAGHPLDGLITVGGEEPQAPAIISSRDSFTDYLRPSPVFAADQLHGYALYAGRYQDPFFKFGLQPGDVVTQINGEAVTDAAEALASLHSLTEGAALTVQIERQGTLQTLSLDGAILAQAIAAGPSPQPKLPFGRGTDVSASLGVTPQ